MIIATLGMLEGCQEKETVDVSAKPDREFTPDTSLLKRLSGKIAFQSDWGDEFPDWTAHSS